MHAHSKLALCRAEDGPNQWAGLRLLLAVSVHPAPRVGLAAPLCLWATPLPPHPAAPQVCVGTVVLLRLQKERERRARMRFAADAGMAALEEQLRRHEQPLLGQAFELAVLACMLWPICQQLAMWIS